MKLTERELKILQLKQKGLSDYRIARKIRTDPPNVTRSRKNAYKKLVNAVKDIQWASSIGVTVSDLDQIPNQYSFFL
jgi:transcriptional regulator